MKLWEPEMVLYFKEDTVIGPRRVPRGSLFKYDSSDIGLIVGKYFYPNGYVSNQVGITGDTLTNKKDKIMFLPEFTEYQSMGINSKYVFKEYALDGASFYTTGEAVVTIPYDKLYYFLYSQCLQKN